MKSIKNNAVVLRFHRQLQVTKVMSKVLAWLRESVVGGLNVMNDPKCNKVQSPCTYRWSQKIQFRSKNFPQRVSLSKREPIFQMTLWTTWYTRNRFNLYTLSTIPPKPPMFIIFCVKNNSNLNVQIFIGWRENFDWKKILVLLNQFWIISICFSCLTNVFFFFSCIHLKFKKITQIDDKKTFG